MDSLSTINLLDLLLRMMVLGQLVLLGSLLLREPATVVRQLMLAAGISVAGLVMLTAPIEDQHYGLWRNLLLVLTDAFAFIFWLLIRYQFDDDFKPSQWPQPVKVVLVLGALVFVYALGVQAGVTPLHDLIHLVGLLLILHSGYVAARGFSADLLDGRRRARIILVLVISLYSTVLVMFEFADDRFRNSAMFGLVNALVLLVACTVATPRLFRLHYDPARPVLSTPETDTAPAPTPPGMPVLSAADARLAQALDAFIAAHGYHQNGLTITSLAQQLDCPEHRLRRLINRIRGFRNFNALLNELRVADAMEKLADPAQDATPILTIALGLGYDSIGPFNRAFKAKTQLTPGEFRRNVQNRR